MLAWIINLGFAASDGGTVVPPVVEPTVTPAGRAKRRRRIFVEVDGETFEAQDQAHAVAILERARELAAKAAEQAAEQAVARRAAAGATAVAPVAIKPPKVWVSERALAQTATEVRNDIRRIYQEAASIAEMRMLMALAIAAQDEEDEAIISLLL